MRRKINQLSENLILCYVAVFIVAALVYVVSCAPGVLWQDSGLFQYRILHNDLQGNLGLALSHPLYIMIGMALKVLPFGDLAYKVNLISAISGAFAVSNLFLLVRLWLGKMVPAIISAISLLVSWTFWQHAAIAEVYTLYAAQMLAELVVLLMYVRSKKIGWLYGLALLNGLSIANHMWAIFGVACYFVLLVYLMSKKVIKFRHVAVVIGLWVLGAMPYEYLIVKNVVLTGDVAGTIQSTLFGGGLKGSGEGSKLSDGWEGGVINSRISPKIIAENIIFIVLNFPTPNILLICAGLFALFKKVPDRLFANLFAGLMLLYFVFAFRYTVPDRYSFFLPVYCYFAILVGVGFELLSKRLSSRGWVCLVVLFAMMPALVYCFMPEIGRKYYKSLGQRRQRPYRDEYVYFLVPWKTGYDGPVRFGRESLEIAEEGSIIYSDTTSVHAILYAQQYEGLRPDVQVISEYDSSVGAVELNERVVSKYMNESAVYVVSPIKGYCPGYLLENYDFEQVWPIYRVVAKK